MDINGLIRQEEELFQLMDRILQMAGEENVVLRVLGAVAVRVQCPDFKYIEYKAGRELSDIDFAAYSKHAGGVENIFKRLSWSENKAIGMFTAGKRRLFIADSGMRSDIFFDRLDMCHEINFKGRLEIDYPAISLVDLLLEKMQIVQINEKDLIDTAVLLLEHDIGDSNKETVDINYLCSLCSSDWGLWRTIDINLAKVHPGRNPQWIKNNINRCAIFKKRHIFSPYNPCHNPLVPMPAGHFISNFKLSLLCNVNFSQFDNSGRQFISNGYIVLLAFNYTIQLFKTDHVIV